MGFFTKIIDKLRKSTIYFYDIFHLFVSFLDADLMVFMIKKTRNPIGPNINVKGNGSVAHQREILSFLDARTMYAPTNKSKAK